MTDEKIDINELIEEWHGPTLITVPLHEHLGLTPEQYKRWVETGDLPNGSNLYDPTREAPGAREADRRLRARARRRALNRLAGRHRDEYLRIINEEILRLRKERDEQ